MMKRKDFDITDGEIKLRLLHVSSGQDSSGYVPVYYFRIQLQDGTEIGQCDLRVGYNHRIVIAGNIGYSVWKRFRGHHYGVKACRLLFVLARQEGMTSAIITCDPDNYPSRRTCELLGGALQGILDTPKNSLEYHLGILQKCQYLIDLSEKNPCAFRNGSVESINEP